MKQTKRLLAFILILTMVLSIIVPVSAEPESTYNPGDIAVINTIIENNGLKWTKAPADGSSVPRDWHIGREMWSNDATNKRLVTLSFHNENITGDIDLRGLTSLEYFACNYRPQITALNLSGLTALRWLHCSDNQLTSVILDSSAPYYSIVVSRNFLTRSAVTGRDNMSGISFTFLPQLYPAQNNSRQRYRRG